MVSLTIGEAKEALLDDWIFAIPERQGEAQQLAIITDACQAIFSPLVGTGSCMIMTEGFPGIAIGAVVFANRAPLPFAQIGAPLAPRIEALVGLL